MSDIRAQDPAAEGCICARVLAGLSPKLDFPSAKRAPVPLNVTTNVIV